MATKQISGEAIETVDHPYYGTVRGFHGDEVLFEKVRQGLVWETLPKPDRCDVAKTRSLVLAVHQLPHLRRRASAWRTHHEHAPGSL